MSYHTLCVGADESCDVIRFALFGRVVKGMDVVEDDSGVADRPERTVRPRESQSPHRDREGLPAVAVGRFDIIFDVTLVRSPQPHDEDIDRLRARLAELDAVLGQRVDELAQAKSQLEAFRIRYRQEVGLLHEELDELERSIDQAELGELSKRVEEGGSEPAAPPPDAQSESAPRYTSDAVRRLFRDVAKTIHPDLARDEATRDRRHTLMAEANRAYALGDEDRLRWVLQAWERSPEAVQDSDPDAARLRLTRRIEQVEEELTVCAADMAALKDSALWQLKTLVDEAAAQGRDLVADAVRRLRRDIMAARNRLDAMKWNP